MSEPVNEKNEHLAKFPTGVETILYVEDEAIARDTTKSVLLQLGYKVISAKDGEEALRVFEMHGEPVDLLLTDIVLPRVNGKKLAEQLGDKQPSLKILLTSGYSDEVTGSQDEGEKYNFIQKPYSPKSLARKIRSVLDK